VVPFSVPNIVSFSCARPMNTTTLRRGDLFRRSLDDVVLPLAFDEVDPLDAVCAYSCTAWREPVADLAQQGRRRRDPSIEPAGEVVLDPPPTGAPRNPKAKPHASSGWAGARFGLSAGNENVWHAETHVKLTRWSRRSPQKSCEPIFRSVQPNEALAASGRAQGAVVTFSEVLMGVTNVAASA
jgi:hypothetical protein